MELLVAFALIALAGAAAARYGADSRDSEPGRWW